jgi:hypothetical protein
MKKALSILLLLIAVEIWSFSQQIQPEVKLTKKDGKYIIEYKEKQFDANEIILTIKPRSNSKLFPGNNVEIVRENKLGFFDVKVPRDRDLEEYAEELKKTGLFDIVEFNAYGEYNDFTPDDSLRSNQWHLSKINMYTAWDINTGSSCVVIGILDSGVDWEHEDLGIGRDSYQNIFLNPGEDTWSDVNDPSTGNGIDDDGNGMIDDWKGWNYANNSNDSRPIFFHGTFVSGIANAKTNNRRGIAGIAGGNQNIGVRLLPYCIGLTAPDGAVVDDAIIDAVDIGAKVINLSISISPTSAMNSAIQYAIDNNVAIVASSGNDSWSSVSYPASNSNVIAVGATTTSNTKASFSNYGTELDLVAPGVDIFSTTLNDSYYTDSGTSYAAPQVCAVAALLFSINNNLTVQRIRNAMESTAQKVGGYSYTTTSGHPNGTWHQQMGYGLLNAYAAMQAVYPYITGPSVVCNTNSTFTLHNLPSGATCSWSFSGGSLVTPSSGNDTTAIFRGTSCSNLGKGNLVYTVTNGDCSYQVVKPDIIVNGPPYQDVTLSVLNSYGQTIPDQSLLCPYTTYHMYIHNNSSCSTSDYTWEVPSGWSLNYTYNDMASITTNDSPWGNVVVKAQTCCTGCGSNVEIHSAYFGESWDCGMMLSVYPNPAGNYADITIKTDNAENFVTYNEREYLITVTDINGTVKFTGKINELPYRLNTTGFKEGMYIVKLVSGERSWASGFMIKH